MPDDITREGDARRLTEHGWRIVHEYGPAWWNDYARRFPNSKVGESRLREEMAHYCVVAALREAREEIACLQSTAAARVVEAARKLHELHDLWADGDPAGKVRFHHAVVELFTAVQSLDAATPASAPDKENGA